MTDGARAQEAVELYASLGYEVRAEPVRRDDVARASAAALAALPVLDLAISEPPIEEVIRRAFRGEAGAAS